MCSNSSCGSWFGARNGLGPLVPFVANTFTGGAFVVKYSGLDGFQNGLYGLASSSPSNVVCPPGDAAGMLIGGRLFMSAYKKPSRLSSDRFSIITTTRCLIRSIPSPAIMLLRQEATLLRIRYGRYFTTKLNAMRVRIRLHTTSPSWIADLWTPSGNPHTTP